MRAATALRWVLAVFFPAFGVLSSPASAQDVVAMPDPCSPLKVVDFPVREGTISISRIAGAVIFQTGLTIDADGAPNAYGPRDRGLDFNANARSHDGKWVSVVTDRHGRPVLQKSRPYRGYYISTTSLEDARVRNDSNRKKYVDATKIPYIVLPQTMAESFGIRLGDFAVVINQANGRSAYAIYADVGPRSHLGEGSIALAKALGLPSDPRSSSAEDGILLLVFPGSGQGPGRLRTLHEIKASTADLYRKWGREERLQACSLRPHSP